MPCSAIAATCSSLSLRPSSAPCTLGCSVLTRPSIISGNPVTWDTSSTLTPEERRRLAVPPVERISTSSDARPRANSTTPVLSETEISARRTFIGASSLLPGTARGAAAPALHVRVDERLDVAVEHSLDVGRLVVGAQVLDLLVRRHHVRADLVAEVDLGLLAVGLLQLLVPRRLAELVELRLEHRHRRAPVLVLAALVLALHDDARRDVRDAHRGLGLVDVLPARAAGAVGVHAQVVVLDLDLALLQLGRDVDRREGRLPPVRRVKRRHAHEPVDADLVLQIAEGPVARDLVGRAAEAGRSEERRVGKEGECGWVRDE